MILIIVIVGLVVAGIFVMILYNGLVGARNEVKNAWSAIDVQLKRRHDLIPNLIESVKGYATHERQTLDEVVRRASRRQPLREASKRGQRSKMH